MCPPHSPTRTTNTSILKLGGAFHWVNTSRIRFCAFSYSAGEPCGRSNQLIMYFILVFLHYINGLEICAPLASGLTWVARDVAAGPGEARDDAGAHGVSDIGHDNGDPIGRRRFLRGKGTCGRMRHQHLEAS